MVKKKRRSHYQREKMAAQFGIEIMTTRQTSRGWRKPKEGFGPRRTWRALGRGWVIYGVLAHTDTNKKWFERWFPTLEAAEAYAAKRHWWLKHPAEERKWVRDESGRTTIERKPLKR